MASPEEGKNRRPKTLARKVAKGKRRSPDKSAQPDLLGAAQASVGNFLRASREALKLTQAEVAERTQSSIWQVSRAAVSAIERGQNFPGVEAMLALSNVLHVDPKEVIERARIGAVPALDLEGLEDDAIEERAKQYFWAGDFRHALSLYEILLDRVDPASVDPAEDAASRLAKLEVARATALNRAGALISAISSAERAISLSERDPVTQAEAYVLAAGIQCSRGHLPLAQDAASRGIELAETTDLPLVQAWAYMAMGRVRFAREDYAPAMKAYQRALEKAESAEDETHRTHIEGNIGLCLFRLGRCDEAREWTDRAVRRARENKQPALEAAWLTQLAKIELSVDELETADRRAEAALRIAVPRELEVTHFAAEWIRYKIRSKQDKKLTNRQRLATLRKLYTRLESNHGIQDLEEFRERILKQKPSSRTE